MRFYREDLFVCITFNRQILITLQKKSLLYIFNLQLQLQFLRIYLIFRIIKNLFDKRT